MAAWIKRQILYKILEWMVITIIFMYMIYQLMQIKNTTP